MHGVCKCLPFGPSGFVFHGVVQATTSVMHGSKLSAGCGAIVFFAVEASIFLQCCMHDRHFVEVKTEIQADHGDHRATDVTKWLQIFWPNRTFENWASRINGPDHFRPIRPSITWTWSEVDRTILQTGHTVCAHVRDGWSCNGSHYAQVLRATHPYQHKRANYNLLGLPPTKILAVGNSMLAELVGSVVCNHK